MNTKRGISEHEIGGRLRPLKFGTNQADIFCRLRKIELAEYLELYKGLKAGKVDIAFTRDTVYSALAEGARWAKQEVDFDHYDVGDWLDENPAVAAAILNTATEGSGPNESPLTVTAEEKESA